MKKILFLCLFAALATSGYAQRGHASVGASIGYAHEYEMATFGVDLRYNVLPDIRIAPSITHMLRNNGWSAWYLDLDAHYVIDVTPTFSFYPIGGISLSIWDWSRYRNDVKHTRVGPNIGLGGEFRIIEEISVGLDFKYNLIRDHDQALGAVRVAYHF